MNFFTRTTTEVSIQDDDGKELYNAYANNKRECIVLLDRIFGQMNPLELKDYLYKQSKWKDEFRRLAREQSTSITTRLS